MQDDDRNLNPDPNSKLSQDDDSNLPLLFDEAFVLKLWLTGPLFLFMAHRLHFKVRAHTHTHTHTHTHL